MPDALEIYFRDFDAAHDTGQSSGLTLEDLFMTAEPDEKNAVDYLTAVLTYSSLIGSEVQMDPVRLDIATKLRKIGMSDISIGILGPMNDRHVRAATIETARAENDLSLYEAALTSLEGMRGVDAQEIRAKAMIALNQELDSRQVPTANETMAWLSNNLERSSHHTNAGIARLAQYMLDTDQINGTTSQEHLSNQRQHRSEEMEDQNKRNNARNEVQSAVTLAELRLILDRARLSMETLEAAMETKTPL